MRRPAISSVVAVCLSLAVSHVCADTVKLDEATFSPPQMLAAAADESGHGAQLFGGVSMAAPTAYPMDPLFGRGTQDATVFTEVPEPSTFFLMIAGLAGIGFVARRRMR